VSLAEFGLFCGVGTQLAHKPNPKRRLGLRPHVADVREGTVPSLAHPPALWDCRALPSAVYYEVGMKTLTVRLPEPLANEIEAESRARRVSKSDVVRERLGRRAAGGRALDPVVGIADLIGSVDGLPADLSSRTKGYLKETRYGRKHPRWHRLSRRVAHPRRRARHCAARAPRLALPLGAAVADPRGCLVHLLGRVRPILRSWHTKSCGSPLRNP
jgi:hypothetical protein